MDNLQCPPSHSSTIRCCLKIGRTDADQWPRFDQRRRKTPEMRLRPYSDVPYASEGQQTPGTRAVARLNLSRLLSYLTRNVHPALCVIDECAVPFAGAPSSCGGGCPTRWSALVTMFIGATRLYRRACGGNRYSRRSSRRGRKSGSIGTESASRSPLPVPAECPLDSSETPGRPCASARRLVNCRGFGRLERASARLAHAAGRYWHRIACSQPH